MATSRTMAHTLTVFYAFGGAAGLLATLGAQGPEHRAWLLAALSGSALLSAAVLTRWGARWPRPAFHFPVTGATVMITTAVVLSPDAATALAVAFLICFVAVDAYFFFPRPQATLHLVVAVGATTGALLTHRDVDPFTALSLDVVVFALCVVTRGLVVRASSASTDPLTGLTNRRGFDDAMDELLVASTRTGERLSAVLIDLDHFKQINDSAGHDAGDVVLRRMADVWRAALPATAVLARHGGDEFSLLLPNLSGAQAVHLVEHVRGLHPDISLSCGVAEFQTGDTGAQLMRRADQALYAAKAAGRGRCQLAPGEPTAHPAAPIAPELSAV